MIVPDLNLLIYAHNSATAEHASARTWWQSCLQGPETIGISWLVAVGFVRLTTSRQVLREPLEVATAFRIVRQWLMQPAVQVLLPGPRHLDLMEKAMATAGLNGNAATDAHLAALAMEHQAELHSNDSDFSRYAGLRWRNPLRG